MDNYNSIKIVEALIILVLLLSPIGSSPAVKHKHSRGSSEREENGAYSPRDKSHYTDGVHNSEYDHESILGSHKTVKEYKQISADAAKERLSVILKRIDLNSDGIITRPELKAWILRSYRMLAEEESTDRFEDADANEDKKVTWEEYFEDTFGDHLEGVQNEDEQYIVEDRRLFKIADKDKDGSLTSDEFFLFTHPEEFPEMVPYILEQALKEKDTNKNGLIDFQEYLGAKAKDQNKAWLVAEKEKFDSELDEDKDGQLNAAEIMEWMLPNNDDMAYEEAGHLISDCDVNNDGLLSYQEALDHYDVFVGSDLAGDLEREHTFSDEL